MKLIKIDSLEDSRLDLYTKYNEAQLLHYFEPKGGVFICETPMVIERALDINCKPLSFLVDEALLNSEVFNKIINRCDDDTVVFYGEINVINKLTGFNLTRGVLSAMVRPDLISVGDLLRDKRRIAILEDVQNPTNVGAIFRSAAALGIEAILLTTNCTDPLYRRSARVAMGTVFQIPYTYLTKNDDINDVLHGFGFKTCSMALKPDAISISDIRFKEIDKLGIILGTEATGLTDTTIEKSDYKVIIPMANGVDSLNVAAASAVAFWELASNK